MASRPTALTTAIAAEIRALMGKRGVTQQQLAAAMSKSQSYVSRRLTLVPDQPFDVDDLDAAAKLLGTTLRRIVEAAEADLARDELSERRGRIEHGQLPAAAYDHEDGTSPDTTDHDFDV